MPLPSTNTRSLRRNARGFFHVEPEGHLDPSQVICDLCGIRERCKMHRHLERMPHQDLALARILACGAFVPTLGFSVLQGLDAARWNTFRMGTAWEKRLTPGDHVAIADTVNGKLLRVMRVASLHAGPLGAMLEAHAGRNHAIQVDPVTDGAAEKLFKVLRNAYGSMVTNEKDFTVISVEEEPEWESSARKASRSAASG